MEQDFIPGFLEVEAEARESTISETERKEHLAKQLRRFDKAQKLVKSHSMVKRLEQYKRETLKLMERQRV